MTADYPTATAPATPEYVWDLLRADALRPRSPYDVVAGDPAVRHFGHSLFHVLLDLDDRYDIDFPSDVEVDFGPTAGRTVREVCEFLAERMTRPVVRPWPHVGGACERAGAFLTVRAMLTEAGGDPARITPSTPVRRYWARYGGTLMAGLRRLAPGCFPPRAAVAPLRGFLCVTVPGAILILLTLLGKAGVDVPVALLLAAVFGGFPVCVAGIVQIRRWEYRQDLGGVRTFRDLAYCLAGQVRPAAGRSRRAG